MSMIGLAWGPPMGGLFQFVISFFPLKFHLFLIFWPTFLEEDGGWAWLDWLGGDLVESLLITSAGTEVTLVWTANTEYIIREYIITEHIITEYIITEYRIFRIQWYVIIVCTEHRIRKLKLDDRIHRTQNTKREKEDARFEKVWAV